MTPAPRSNWMLPSATLTMVVSRNVRNSTASTVARATPRGTDRVAGFGVDTSVRQSRRGRCVACRRRVALGGEQTAERRAGDLPRPVLADGVAGLVRQDRRLVQQHGED